MPESLNDAAGDGRVLGGSPLGTPVRIDDVVVADVRPTLLLMDGADASGILFPTGRRSSDSHNAKRRFPASSHDDDVLSYCQNITSR